MNIALSWAHSMIGPVPAGGTPSRRPALSMNPAARSLSKISGKK